jgi:hypothetical protein
VRRGRGNLIRVRRATIIMVSSSGMPVAAIARLVIADEDTVRDVIRAFNERGLARWTLSGREAVPACAAGWPDLHDELVELLHPRLAQVVPVRLLDLPAADLGHEHVPAHPDAAVDAPHRPGDAVAAEGAEHARACW